MTATVSDSTTAYPPGARILVRDEEWLVRSASQTAHDGYRIEAIGVSELVLDDKATFFDGIDRVELLRPEHTQLVADTTPNFRRSRLYLEAVLRRTPVPRTETGLALPTPSCETVDLPDPPSRAGTARAASTGAHRRRGGLGQDPGDRVAAG